MNIYVKIGKLMSKVLRHSPEVLGLTLDENGWCDYETLKTAVKGNYKHLDIADEMITHTIETNDKKRYSFNEDGTKIRAAQGHTLQVNVVDKEVNIGPDGLTLFHGTPKENLDLIMTFGLKKMKRNHVHMSADVTTAEIVAKRFKKDYVIFELFFKQGTKGIYISDNNVYLADNVSPEYIVKYVEYKI